MSSRCYGTRRRSVPTPVSTPMQRQKASTCAADAAQNSSVPPRSSTPTAAGRPSSTRRTPMRWRPASTTHWGLGGPRSSAPPAAGTSAMFSRGRLRHAHRPALLHQRDCSASSGELTPPFVQGSSETNPASSSASPLTRRPVKKGTSSRTWRRASVYRILYIRSTIRSRVGLSKARIHS